LIYEYQSDDGETVEIDMPMMADHPPVVERKGKKFYRRFSTAGIVWGSFRNDDIKFKKPPIESNLEYT
jgi:hypothetical protein